MVGGRNLDNLLYRSSLVKVDGFKSPEEFEKSVNETNLKANLLIKEKDSKRFELKYGSNVKESSLLKQT